MDIPHLVLMFMIMLLCAVLLAPLARRIHLPFSAILVLGGFLGSELIVAVGLDTGLRWHHFHDLIFFMLLPVLIFESALNMNVHLLFKNLIPILILAIPLMFLGAVVTALLLYFGIAHAEGFPLIAALLTGALLSATDPVAVLNLFKSVNAPERLGILVEGESLFNDATAIVLFGLFLSLAQADEASFSFLSALWQFLKIFFGGFGVGLVIGLFSLILYKLKYNAVVQGAISLISAYGSFIIAEEFFAVSGVMSVLVTGLFISWERTHNPERYHYFLGELWEFNAYVANAMIFLLMGITITAGMFVNQWLAMLLGIAAVLIARAIGIFGIIPLVSRLPGVEPIGIEYQAIMFWGGLRGVIVLALALSLPLELEYWYTIQSIAYGVVIFTLFIQAPTIQLLMKKVHL